MTIDLDDLEAKARAAGVGKWVRGSMYIGRWDEDGIYCPFAVAPRRGSDGPLWNANAAYIVAAQPAAVLELIARVRELEAGAGEPVAKAHWLSDFTVNYCNYAALDSAVDVLRTCMASKSTQAALWAAIIDYVERAKPSQRSEKATNAAPVSHAALKARVRELEEALQKIAGLNDKFAERKLAETGSYLHFDEPVSVKIARTTLGGSND